MSKQRDAVLHIVVAILVFGTTRLEGGTDEIKSGVPSKHVNVEVNKLAEKYELGQH